MKNRNFRIEVYIVFFEYNAETNSLDLKTHQKVIPGDETIIADTVIELKQTQLRRDEGFLVESWTYTDYISGYTQDIIPVSQGFMQTKYSLNAPVFLQFELRMELSQTIITVQWIKLSQLLAMFMSIFSALLSIGILGKMSSQAMIYQEMMENYLKEYYRETAENLATISNKERAEAEKKLQELSKNHNTFGKLQDKMGKENILAANNEFGA